MDARGGRVFDGDGLIAGARVAVADVEDPACLSASSGPFADGSVDVVISCLASRTGAP